MRKLVLVLAALVTLPLIALLVFSPLMMMGFMGAGGDEESAQPPLSDCAVEWRGKVPPEAKDLDKTQLNLVQVIYDQAHKAGFSQTDAKQAAVIGVMTALQESNLGKDPDTHRINPDGDAGPFQIRVRVSWHAETLAQALDPVYAAKVFFQGKVVTTEEARRAREADVLEPNPAGYTIPGLKQIANWQGMKPGDAAQAVQVSAYPRAYDKHEPLARALIENLSTGKDPATPPDALLCGPVGAASCASTGQPDLEKGLTPDALRVFRCGKARYPMIKSWSLVREDSLQWHPTGRALDFMIPNWESPQGHALGVDIARWLQANAARFGVDHIIFDRQIWSPARQKEGWRPCSAGSCYAGPDPTQAHLDHVHVAVLGNAGKDPAPSGSGGGTVLPIKGGYLLTARFGQCGTRWANCHTGLDFAAPIGTPALSVQNGTVISASWGGAYGNLVKVDHGGGVVSYYAHLSSMRVSPGDQVKAGTLIGYVGATGNVTGAHLHLEVRVGGSPTDPDPWLRGKGLNP